MLNVQVTKDTFYATLQSRIAAGNAARTVVVRGVLRPAVLVEENELPGTAVDGVPMAETFCLQWLDLDVDCQHPIPMVRIGCEICYASDGTTGAAGMDRGRALAAMDGELATALATGALHVAATSWAEISGGGSSTATATGWNVFWSGLTFGPVKTRGERMERTVRVEVFGYGE